MTQMRRVGSAWVPPCEYCEATGFCTDALVCTSNMVFATVIGISPFSCLHPNRDRISSNPSCRNRPLDQIGPGADIRGVSLHVWGIGLWTRA